MEKFPFYGLEPHERMSKLREHFLRLEEESTRKAIELEMQRLKIDIAKAAAIEAPKNDAMITCGEGLIVELGPRNIRQLLEELKNMY